MPAPNVAHPPRPDFGARLRQVREGANMTRTELGAAVGRSEQSVVAWEKCSRSPNLSTVFVVAAALGVSAAELLAEPEPGAD